MTHRIVSAHLLRVESSVALTRASATLAPTSCRANVLPAVLIIPRGNDPREPYLVVLSTQPSICEQRASACVVTDLHAVARVEDPRHPAADVLVCQQRRGLLRRHRGSAVVVNVRLKNCLLELPDGHLVEVRGPAVSSAKDRLYWAMVYGSVLHCWLVAGMPIKAFEEAVVAVGHLLPGLPVQFSVAGRTRARVRRRGSTTSTRRAA